MGILPILTLLCALFSVSMATETKTAEDSAESEVQLSSDEPAMSYWWRRSGGRSRQRCHGWRRFRNRCFKYFNTRTTWAKAEGLCVRQGGHLASIHNRAECRVVKRLLRSSAWIGGGGAMKGFTWYWTDGTRFDYSNWHAWEPNNHGGNEHCIQMWARGRASGTWNDAPCDYRGSGFVCAK